MFHLFTWRSHLIQKPLPAIIPSTRKDGTWFVYTRIIIQRTFIWASAANVLKKAAAQVVLKKRILLLSLKIIRKSKFYRFSQSALNHPFTTFLRKTHPKASKEYNTSRTTSYLCNVIRNKWWQMNPIFFNQLNFNYYGFRVCSDQKSVWLWRHKDREVCSEICTFGTDEF